MNLREAYVSMPPLYTFTAQLIAPVVTERGSRDRADYTRTIQEQVGVNRTV